MEATLIGVFVLSVLIFLYWTWTLMFVRNIDTEAFMAQIQKLIMANNLDRAIKLCNAAPNAVMTQLTKSVLICANQPHRLYLAYLQTTFKLNHEAKNLKKSPTRITIIILIYGLLVMGFVVQPLGWTLGAVLGIIAFVLLSLTSAFISARLVKTKKDKLYLFRLMDLLQYRMANYNTDESNEGLTFMQARPLTEDELARRMSTGAPPPKVRPSPVDELKSKLQSELLPKL
ncbi:hypothetical protein HOL46_00410 [Candidatus Falkowbacteria bacterium]|nr:hypothetical protein [Candidatus Falkowbacteria bacterium]